MKLVNSKTATIAVAAGLVVLAGASGAAAGSLITSADIATNGVHQIDIGHAAVSGHGATGQSEVQAQSLNQADIAKGGVSGSQGAGNSEIQHGSVGMKDLAPGVLDGITGPQGPPGEQGERGKQGPPGEQGEQGESAYELAQDQGFTGSKDDWFQLMYSGTGYEIVGRNSDRKTIQVDTPTKVSTLCSSHNEVAIAGGVRTISGFVNIEQSYPDPRAASPGNPNRYLASGWTVWVAAQGGPAVVQPYVICANMTTKLAPSNQ